MAKPVKKRGALLTIWLILMLVSYVTSLAILTLWLFFGKYFTANLSELPYAITHVWVIYASIIGALLGIVFTIFLFLWKKWAFFAFCGLAGIGFVFNIIQGTSIVLSVLGLLGPVILYLLIRPKWKFFE
jgi:hypothetical protein